MKLAVITDEIDADLGHALDVMAEYGVRGAELRQLWDKSISEAPLEYWERAKRELGSRGMTVVGIASPFYKCSLPGAEPDGPAGPLHGASARGLGDQITLLERCLEAAQFFNTALIRTFSFWKHGPLTPEQEETIVDAYAEPAAMAERAGVILGIENEHACCLGTGAQTARVLEEIGSPSVQAIWDPGNALMAGELPYPDGYAAIKDFAAHVHIKDAFVPAGALAPEWTIVGKGAIDYAGQLAALKRDGYDGWLSLETHYSGPATETWSSKEASSRACLEGLQKLLAQTA
jgi:sugar phosphate isomerase/epimerase